MSYLDEEQGCFDELLEFRRLQFNIRRAQNELAKAEYSRTKSLMDLELLKKASGQFSGYIQSKEVGGKHVKKGDSALYEELLICYDRPLGTVPAYNGLMQNLEGASLDLNEISPAPSNEGNKLAIYCEVLIASQIEKIKSIMDMIPYAFDLLVLCCEDSVKDRISEIKSDNLCELVVRTPKNGQHLKSNTEIFIDCVNDYDELLIIDLNNADSISNLIIRKSAALFHNILDLVYLESDIKWIHVSRLRQTGIDLLSFITDDNKMLVLSDNIAVACIEDNIRVIIDRVDLSQDTENEDSDVNKKNYEIPEDVESMRQELIKCLDRITELENEQNDLKESVQKKKDETDVRSRNIIEKMEKQMSILKMENIELKVANAAIKDSISWKITKPVRDFGALFIK